MGGQSPSRGKIRPPTPTVIIYIGFSCNYLCVECRNSRIIIVVDLYYKDKEKRFTTKKERITNKINFPRKMFGAKFMKNVL